MMTRRFLPYALLLLGTLAPGRTVFAQPPEPEQARLKAIITKLADPEFEGRRGEGGQKAAAYIVEQFRTLGLEPLFDGDFYQNIPAREEGKIQGRNVGAILRGSDPELRTQWLIVSAHFDHLGVRDGVLYPGADDNASGVAMMLEIARCFTQGAEKPRRSIMFIGFDLEEIGLFGSRYFAEHSPIPLSRVALFVTADMIGRSLGGGCTEYVFVMGSEHVPSVRPWIEEAASQRPALKVGLLGSDLLLLDRSDYGPFRSRKVPFLFFSTGENPCYHSPRDVPETINYPKAESITRVVFDVCREAARSPEPPRWVAAADNPLAEAVTLRGAMSCLLERREELQIGRTQIVLMTNAIRTLDAIIARGEFTPSERAGILNVARFVLASVL